jgi:hypothetical protein
MEWQGFFTNYATASLTGTPEELAAFYAEGFVAAGPKGAFGGQNDESFLEWLGQIQQANPMQSLRPAEVGSESDVGPHHRMVTVLWASRFASSPDREICFPITYILHLQGPRIVAYISHQDEEERKRAEGIPV